MSPTQRRLSIALAISLGLNLFLGGFAVARLMRPRHQHGLGPHPMAAPAGMLRDLDDPSVRKHVERMFKGRHEDFARDRKRMGEARHKIARALEREPPDRQELAAAFAELRTVTTASQAELHASLIELAATLSPEQRAKLIRKWTRGARQRHPGGADPTSDSP